MKIFTLLLLCFLFCSACIDSAVKILGNNLQSTNPTSTANASTFRFRYAYLNTALSTIPDNQIVFLAGANNSATAILETCSASGTSCACVFENSSGTVIGTTTASSISYDTSGNYLRCSAGIATGGAGAISKVYVKNTANTIVSSTLTVVSSLTNADILGELDTNYLRNIYQYNCNVYYLYKAGITNSFTCTAGTFSILIAPFNFYLYGDNANNNFSSKPADYLYGAATGGTVCGAQIKEYDCTASTPTVQFGIYALNKGIFNTPISLTNAPLGTNSLYGYATAITSYTDNYSGISNTSACPAGMVAANVYQASISAIANSNMPANTDTIFAKTSNAPTNFVVSQTANGSCNGATLTCIPPVVTASVTPPPQSDAYSISGSTVCVVP